MGMNDTPRAERLHIALFGRRNAGKSSLINALTGQETALVSPEAGTTTDPVYKAMELHGFGPVVFIDTPGLDDAGALGEMRVKRALAVLDETDLALLVFDRVPDACEGWPGEILKRGIPAIAVINKCDAAEDADAAAEAVGARWGQETVRVSARDGRGIALLRRRIAERAPEAFGDVSVTGDLAGDGDTVLLVMPQDIEAPRGRLILPQVQTIRDLLDKKCVVTACTADRMDAALSALSAPPRLIITDSQAFREVYPKKPEGSRLTSFSILYAAYKGDIRAFIEGAAALEGLTEDSRVLIAEACTHAPAEEDIGRVKIPALLRRRTGAGLKVDFVRGRDFPKDLKSYDLIIHCGACMFNRRQMTGRIAEAREQGVPICNYGIVLAYLNGILDKVEIPG